MHVVSNNYDFKITDFNLALLKNQPQGNFQADQVDNNLIRSLNCMKQHLKQKLFSSGYRYSRHCMTVA